MTTWITEIRDVASLAQLLRFKDQMGRDFILSKSVLQELVHASNPAPEATLGGLPTITHWDQARDLISQLKSSSIRQEPVQPARPRPVLVWSNPKKVDE